MPKARSGCIAGGIAVFALGSVAAGCSARGKPPADDLLTSINASFPPALDLEGGQVMQAFMNPVTGEWRIPSDVARHDGGTDVRVESAPGMGLYVCSLPAQR